MRKSIFLLCAMLCCSQAFCQEAEAVADYSESETQWLIIPRLDFNTYAPTKDGAYSGYDLGNTSLYTLFDGSFGDSNFSYSVEGHLLSSDPVSLYKNAFCSQESTFLDWANVSYQLKNFKLTLGKDVLAIGTFEYDDYDYDAHLNLNSTFWNNASVYQWGGSLSFITNDESNTLTYQFSSSPLGEHPFSARKNDDALYAHSVKWSTEYDFISSLSSFNAMEYAKGKYIYAVALGVQVPVFSFLSVGVDFLSRSYDSVDLFKEETSVIGRINIDPTDRLSFRLKYGYEYNHSKYDVFGWEEDSVEAYHDYYVPCSLSYMNIFQKKDYVFGGIQCHYLPLRNSRNLRLHGVVSYNNWAESVSINMGLTYYFNLYR